MHYEIDQKNWGVSMDLKDFYLQNIQKDEYHYRFYDLIENVNNVCNIPSYYTEVMGYEFEVHNAEEAITKFRKLCQPEEKFSVNEKNVCFILYRIIYTK